MINSNINIRNEVREVLFLFFCFGQNEILRKLIHIFNIENNLVMGPHIFNKENNLVIGPHV